MHKDWKANALMRLTQVLVWLVFAVGALAWITMPWMLENHLSFLLGLYIIVPTYKSTLLVFVMVVGAGFLWIVGELAFVLRTLGSNPFVQRNVSALRRVGIVGFLIALVFLIRCLQYLSPMTVVVAAMLVIMALCALVIASVFAKAIHFKQENDLTI